MTTRSGKAPSSDDHRTISQGARATITPAAAVIDSSGAVRYRGRIDDLYPALGQRRRVATTHDLADAVEAVVSGRVVAHPETEAVGCFIGPPKGARE